MALSNSAIAASCSHMRPRVCPSGEIALECYGMGSGPERLPTSYSTAKSITATLVGAALHDGVIASLGDRCESYLPRLCASAYAGVTVRNLLQMCSVVARPELDGGQVNVEGLDQALARRRPGSLLELACSLPRAHPQGAVFNYSTVDSCMFGALVAAATGRTLADYGAETIWGPAGMEADALWLLEAEGGLECGGFGVGVRLRDMGRFGLLVLDDGVAFSGRRVLPPRLARSRRPARLRAQRLRPADAGQHPGIRLPVVGAAARADRHPPRRLCGDRRLRPVHLRPSG
jgi:CubicO group peptidase (beta-lactamase class C family)